MKLGETKMIHLVFGELTQDIQTSDESLTVFLAMLKDAEWSEEMWTQEFGELPKLLTPEENQEAD